MNPHNEASFDAFNIKSQDTKLEYNESFEIGRSGSSTLFFYFVIQILNIYLFYFIYHWNY